MKPYHAFAIVLTAITTVCPAASAQNVRMTPVGSHPGELCMRDRATILEDPSGVRVLYDAGQSVTGADVLANRRREAARSCFAFSAAHLPCASRRFILME